MVRPEDLLVALIRRDRAIDPDSSLVEAEAQMWIEDLEDQRVLLEGWVQFKGEGHFEARYVLDGSWFQIGPW